MTAWRNRMYVQWTAHVIGLFRAAEGRLPKDLEEVFSHRLPTGKGGSGTQDIYGGPLEFEPAKDGSGFVLTSRGKDGKPGGGGADADVTVREP